MRLSAIRCLAASALLSFAAIGASADEQVTITLDRTTKVTGILGVNAYGKAVQSFRGIRYAEAPVGTKRWKPTALLKPSGSINATAAANVCYTDRRFDAAPKYPESEDCLFINVFAPAGASAASKLPVMVWTHGGSWVSGSGYVYDGGNLAASTNGTKAIVVTFNYRLGMMGFLTSDAQLQEGNGANFALRDMENAFKWVRSNIAGFGGNPSDVTAFGESAGAMMIAMQMLTNNGAQTLFHKAILESGAYPSFAQVMSKTEQATYLNKVATTVGCTDPTTQLLCLRSTEVSALVAAGTGLDWRPTVDAKFLVDAPYSLVKAGKVSKIPTIFGTNTDEGYPFTYTVSSEAVMFATLRYSNPSLTDADLATIGSLYPAASFATPALRASQIVGDYIFVCPSETMTNTMAAKYLPTYHYRFNVTSPFAGFGPQLAIHTAEIPFVFNDARVPATPAAQSVVTNMQKFWTNFAKSGTPNLKDTSASVWPRYTISCKEQIVLQPTLTVEVNGAYMPLHAERCAFWASIEARIAAANAASV